AAQREALAIGAEGQGAHLVVVLAGLPHPGLVGDVPELDLRRQVAGPGGAWPARGQPLPVGTEGYGNDQAALGRDLADLLAGGRLPGAHGPVAAAGRDERAPARLRHGAQAAEAPDLRPGRLEVPQNHLADELPPLRRDGLD